MYSAGKLRFPLLCPTLLTWSSSTVSSIRHFEVALKSGSRWLSKCIVGLLWGTNLPPCWKCVPQNSPTMHLTAISTRFSAQPRSDEYTFAKHRLKIAGKKREWGMMGTRAGSEREEVRRKTIKRGALLPWIIILSKISLAKITDREQLGRSRSLHLFHSQQSLNFTFPSLFITITNVG